MSDVKQVKVDNWGIYFLQRLKHFFNRTDYCDLTLQFQDNAQLKVHRLVLSACTEYFELLERTCEMYEDCLVMPDDLQADVVVPIVNFMYTGHLEFKMDLLERLYQTSQILNMPVLSKLLESHRNLAPKAPAHSYSGIKKFPKQSVQNEPKPVKTTSPAGSSIKRSYSKAFESNVVYKDKKNYQSNARMENVNTNAYRPPSPISKDHFTPQRTAVSDPRPTRYEVPEELDTDNIFDNSFCSISYTSQPLMVHPDTVKRYKAKRSNVFNEASGSKKVSGLSTIDIVECKRIPKEDSLFDDTNTEHNFNDETDLFNTPFMNNEKNSNQLFDQILDANDGNSGPKVTIETKDSKAASNLDHARIISEVLKKYPHLVKSNKNIKLKILDPVPSKGKKQQKQAPAYIEDKPIKFKTEKDDFTYETDVIDSKQAAKLIAMGADNTKGPWICLICGTPGKALHFNSYYKFRRHLVEVHNEKPVANICEYCGLRSLKRNYLLHHLYAQHGVEPPPQYHFPKCNMCTYIALTDALLAKHKLSHKSVKNFRCNVCSVAFATSSQLLQHIQVTGHKYSAEKKSNLQCIYCLKVFLREINLYSHIKTHHKQEAKRDGIIDDSDDEKPTVTEEPVRPRTKSAVKFEPSTSYDNDYEDVDIQYPAQQRPSTDKQVPARRQHNVIPNTKQKILNPGFDTPKPAPKAKASKSTIHTQSVHNDFFQDIKMPVESLSNNQNEEIVLIDNNEYIMRDHQLIPRKRKPECRDYIISDMVEPDSLETMQQPTTSEYTHVQNATIEENIQHQSSMVIKKSTNLNQPIQIVVSNEEEYKALMASNHPIIFDDGGTNKTLTVLTAPHHNQAIETTAIDLDNTQGNEMMILPHEYPLNVSEAVATENSNIVVVYSHPVDDKNKQFQIITTGGIGAQFVQSSAIITQNYETVTTSTQAMNTHCIETQVEQTWQNNIQSLEGQQIQLPPHTVMLNSNQIVTGPIHSATDDHLGDLPEVHLVPESQKGLSPDETDVTLNQSDVTIEQVNQPDETMEDNVPLMRLIKKKTTANEIVENVPQSNSMPNIQTNHENMEEPMEMQSMLEQPPTSEHTLQQPMPTENILQHQMREENVIEQPMETVIFQDQPIQTENVFEQSATDTEIVLAQPMETENLRDQPIVTEYIVEQPLVTGNVMVLEQPLENEMEQTTVHMVSQPTVHMMEQQVETRNTMESIQTENMIVQHVKTGNVLEQPIETETPIEQSVVLENMMNQPAELENDIVPVERENVTEEPIRTECLIESSHASQNQQEHTLDSVTINKYSEVEKPQNDTSEGQQSELLESQAYDDIVEINHINNEEPVYAKESEKKIKNLTLDWSEDEYDVAEENGNTKSVSNEGSQNEPLAEEIPEVEESIENIQQEMKKQMAAHIEVEATAQLDVHAAAQLHVVATAQLEVEATAQLDVGAAADVDTEESAISSQEEDSSSQEMHLPPLIESPVPNPLVQEKLSSLLNDWEDNDSQEEMITADENVVEPTTEESTKETSVDSADTPEVPKNDNIKSLVSDWSDDEEETKE